MYSYLKDKLPSIGISIAQHLSDDKDSGGDKIERFAAEKAGRLVTVEVYADGEVDAFYIDDQEPIPVDFTVSKSNLYLIRFDESKNWNDNQLKSLNPGKIYGVYLADANKLVNCAEITPSVWLDFVRNDTENELEWPSDEDAISFELNNGNSEGMYVHASSIQEMIEKDVDTISAGDFIWGDEDEYTLEIDKKLDELSGNFSDFNIAKMCEKKDASSEQLLFDGNQKDNETSVLIQKP
jgi:hypothetical protein